MSHNPRRREFLKLSTAVGSGLLLADLPLLADTPADAENAEEMSLFTAIRKRRSVRQFKPDPIPDDHMKQILQAARLAPTSGNQQPWQFLVVDDRAKIDELKADCVEYRIGQIQEQNELTAEQIVTQRERIAGGLAGYFTAPVYVVILTSANSRYPDYNHWDGPLAAANLMLAARALGYGTVFITDSIPEEVTKQTFNIPDEMTRVCITPIGVPESWPGQPSKKPWRSFVVKNSF